MVCWSFLHSQQWWHIPTNYEYLNFITKITSLILYMSWEKIIEKIRYTWEKRTVYSTVIHKQFMICPYWMSDMFSLCFFGYTGWLRLKGSWDNKVTVQTVDRPFLGTWCPTFYLLTVVPFKDDSMLLSVLFQ